MKNKFVLLQVFLLVFIMNIVNAQPCTNCQGTQDNNDNSSAIGVGTKAFGTASFASGLYSEATNIGTTAIGFRNTSIGNYSTTLGNFLKASEAHSIVIGDGYDVGFELVNNKPYSLMIGFESTKPTFFISTSPEMHKTGRVAIGNVNMAVPLAKLHIRADAGEDAAILIEPNTWNTGAEAHLLLGNANNGISVQKQVEGADLLFRSERNYLFNSTGYLGINTLEPQYNLHVEGSMFTKSFRLYNDALPPIEEGFVLVADEFGNAYWGNPTTVSLWQLNGNGNDIYYMGGKVGIGIEAPEEMLDVAGNILVNDAITGKEANGRWNDPFFLTLRGSSNEFSSKIMLYKGDGGTNQHEIKIINPLPDGVVQFHVGGKINFVVRTNETVLGAQNETDYALKVNGKILTNEVEVLVEQWNDKVFEKNYPLMPLMELENYLQQNKHLPDLPPEKEVLENGIELGMLNALLLKKIEELTLYTIEQQKMMVKHLEMIENQQQQINELKQYVND